MPESDPGLLQPQTVRDGDILSRKYRVERVLSQGAVSAVVVARNLDLDTQVVVKLLLPQGLTNREVVCRFMREARATARLKSPHVVHVSDVGELENGAPYMVMEFLDGQDLSVLLRKQKRLALDRAVEYILQACEAVEEAHAHGIIHRDLKPANLFLTTLPSGEDCIKVLDFGISKFQTPGPELDLETHSRRVIGSPLYMAPEQMRSSRTADQRADIWSLGATLYELLTGRPPFLGKTMMELCIQVAQDSPLPIRTIRPTVSSTLEKVVLRCLEKAPADRYQTAAELAAALRSTNLDISGLAPAPVSTVPVDSSALPIQLRPVSIADSGRRNAMLADTLEASDRLSVTRRDRMGRKAALITIGLTGACIGVVATVAPRGRLPGSDGASSAAQMSQGAIPTAPSETRANPSASSSSPTPTMRTNRPASATPSQPPGPTRPRL